MFDDADNDWRHVGSCTPPTPRRLPATTDSIESAAGGRGGAGAPRICATLPMDVLPSHGELAKLLANTRRRWRDALGSACGCRGAPCLYWCGPERTRYRNRRWIPKRLFYALCVPGGYERVAPACARNTVTSACGHADCIEPLHMQLSLYVPPTKRPLISAKKVGDDDDEMALRATSGSGGRGGGAPRGAPASKRQRVVSVVEESRRIMEAMYEELERLDSLEDAADEDDESSPSLAHSLTVLPPSLEAKLRARADALLLQL